MKLIVMITVFSATVLSATFSAPELPRKNFTTNAEIEAHSKGTK